MELKLVCDCGQKFKFDVEPVNGQMPYPVNCPSCGMDRTEAANAALGQIGFVVETASPVSVRINRPPPPTASAEMPRPAAPILRPAVPVAPKASSHHPGEFNLGLGILGALIGAVVGAGVMYGFYQWAGFRFPLLGVGIGALTGFGAKLLYKGTDHALGVISGVISLVAVVGTLWLMYGEFPILSIISVVISVGVAYRVAG
jgi:hypothetical protein